MAALLVSSALGGPLQATTDELPYFTGPVSFRRLNLLTQQRRTYEDIRDLANQFAIAGWLMPPLIAVHTRAGALAHVQYVNRVFGAHHTLDDMMVLSRRPLRYGFVIAGHRRILANHVLWEEGCDNCLSEFGVEPPGTCFQRHLQEYTNGLLSDDQIEAKMYPGIEPREALIKQCSENDGIRRPPPQEVADTLDRHAAVIRADCPDLSLSAIAREMKVHPARLKRAMQYCRLPEYFHEDVEDGRISFGVALEMGRLLGRASDGMIEIMRQGFILRKVTAAQAKRELDDRFRGSAFNEFSFDGMNDSDLLPELKRAMRKPWERQNTSVIHAATAVFRRAAVDFETGRLGFPDAMYLDTTLMRSWRDMVDYMKAIMPEMRRRLDEAQAKGDEAVILEFENILGVLMPAEPQAPESNLFAIAGD